ncbi:MAG: DUF192 domain-containing protein [Actinobacteria bacterium]|nr:DUF192 domain-containing protein [Actinomycetota bacterium]
MGPIPRLLRDAATALVIAAGALAACSGAAAPPAASEVVHATEAPTFGTSADGWASARVELVDADGTTHVVPVRVAAEPEQRRQGLMGVEEVPPGTGMLFLWDGSERTGGFWMKDTLVPLDIAYIRSGEIVDIQRMEPCPEYDDPRTDCPSYPPAAPYDTALEVAAGWFAAQDVVVGSAVTLPGTTTTAGS